MKRPWLCIFLMVLAIEYLINFVLFPNRYEPMVFDCSSEERAIDTAVEQLNRIDDFGGEAEFSSSARVDYVSVIMFSCRSLDNLHKLHGMARNTIRHRVMDLQHDADFVELHRVCQATEEKNTRELRQAMVEAIHQAFAGK